MTTKSKDRIRSMDMPIIDKVFAMEGGWVLNFGNRTFAEFFREELGVNIDHSRWAVKGDSKAKRLRYYLRQADRQTALETLNALWEYREASTVTENYPELEDATRAAFFKIIERLKGEPLMPVVPTTVSPEPRNDETIASDLADHLREVDRLAPQKRGYAFEKFLKDVFNAYGLSARAPFCLVGEQIDGSFVLDDNTYLLEAKWTNAKVDAAALRAFNAKVEDKATWSRGLFVSHSGFTTEGLTAFGHGKSVICMDGCDIHDVLSRRLNFAEVLAMKVRHAAETGEAFISVRDLKSK